MSYLKQQSAIKRNYYYFLLLFMIVVFILMASSTVIIILVIRIFQPAASALAITLVWSSVMLISMITVGMARVSSLSEGGHAVAEQLSAVEVYDDALSLSLRRVRNVVEEVAIAYGAPVPRIYILYDEDAINAMAAGFTMNDAALIITSGALKYLNRDELQAVVAHEFSHIMNGDMRLNTKLIGYLASIEFIYDFGVQLYHIHPLGMPLIILGYSGIFSSHFIKAAINRNREHRADVEAIRHTRLSEGLAGALKKIACLQSGSLIINPRFENVCHLFFSESSVFASLFQTHPSIISRLQSIDPGFSRSELSVLRKKWLKLPPDGLKEDESNDLKEVINVSSLATLNSLAGLQALTSINQSHRDQARLIINRIPQLLKNAARNQYSVVPLLLALKFSKYEVIKVKQREIILERYDKKILSVVDKFDDSIDQINLSIKLPLAFMCFPSLRHISSDKRLYMLETVRELDHVDDTNNIYVYCFSHLLTGAIRDCQDGKDVSLHGSQRLRYVIKAVSHLMSVMATVGNEEFKNAECAYHVGMSAIYPDLKASYEPVHDMTVTLDSVWADLDDLDPSEKEILIAGLAACIYSDNVKSLDEIELLRTVCASLHCPLPMMVEMLPSS